MFAPQDAEKHFNNIQQGLTATGVSSDGAPVGHLSWTYALTTFGCAAERQAFNMCYCCLKVSSLHERA